jgi:hypothetical protein
MINLSRNEITNGFDQLCGFRQSDFQRCDQSPLRSLKNCLVIRELENLCRRIFFLFQVDFFFFLFLKIADKHDFLEPTAK